MIAELTKIAKKEDYALDATTGEVAGSAAIGATVAAGLSRRGRRLKSAVVGGGLGALEGAIFGQARADEEKNSTLKKKASANAKAQRKRIAGLSDSGKNKNKAGLTHTPYWNAVDGMAAKQKNIAFGKEAAKDVNRAKNRFNSALSAAEKSSGNKVISSSVKAKISGPMKNDTINKHVTEKGQEAKGSFKGLARMNRKSYPTEDMKKADTKKKADEKFNKERKSRNANAGGQPSSEPRKGAGGVGGGPKNTNKGPGINKKPKLSTKSKVGLGLAALGTAGLVYHNNKEN